jgi:hypothetical protein
MDKVSFDSTPVCSRSDSKRILYVHIVFSLPAHSMTFWLNLGTFFLSISPQYTWLFMGEPFLHKVKQLPIEWYKSHSDLKEKRFPLEKNPFVSERKTISL